MLHLLKPFKTSEEKRMRHLATLLMEQQPTDRLLERLGEFIEPLASGSGGSYEAATLLLIRLLPQLKATDAGHLSTRHREILYRALRGRHSDLIRAILKAFEQVGDAQAIPHVKPLVNCPVWIANYGRIRQEAQECLAFLEIRAEEQQAERTLLRPGHALDGTGEHLLRPSDNETAPDVTNLLRPHSS